MKLYLSTLPRLWARGTLDSFSLAAIIEHEADVLLEYDERKGLADTKSVTGSSGAAERPKKSDTEVYE